MGSNQLLSPRQAAVFLGLQEKAGISRLAKLRHYGGGPVFVRIGRTIRYDRADLNAWIQKNKRRSTSDRGGETHQT